MISETNLEKINENLRKSCPLKDQYYFGHGKLLLTGEYLVLDGALSLALPTKLGQSLSVKYSQSYSPTLHWKSYDLKGNLWFDHKFEFWHFKCLTSDNSKEADVISKLLQTVRKQNPHFLRDEVDVLVETRLGFPLEWGLGSSSSLIYNIAQWAYVSPFELLFKTSGGSGYDIACAQSEAPILYKKTNVGPNWSPVHFNPTFKDNLFFVYLGKKKDSNLAIKEFNKKRPVDPNIVNEITELTQAFLNVSTLLDFQKLIKKHEQIIANIIGEKPVKESCFNDFNGEIKSLGAWGGDFILVATEMNLIETKDYFTQHNLNTVFNYTDLISPIENISNLNNQKHPAHNLIH